MAWLTRQDAHQFSITPRDPDLETLSYWLARLEPLIRAEQTGEIIVVFANRTGMEGSAVYAGTSAVIGIHDGEVKLYGVLGRGERELLLVDTDLGPQAKLVSDPVPPPTTETTQSRSTPQSHGSHETRATTPEPDTEFLVSIDGVLSALSPVSPVSAKYPSTYFPSPTSSTAGRKGKILESSLHNKNSTIASPDPERQERPTSMIQTTSSRERTPEWEEQSAINSDLINSDVTATSHADHDPKTSQNEQSEQIPEKESVIYTNGDDYGIGGPFTAPMSNIPGLRITEKTPSPTLPAEGPRNHQVGQLGERESLKERPRSVAW
jgi:protein N-terminal amidase